MCPAAYGTINNPFVGADAYIGPPYCTPLQNILSLRSQCAHWPWQSVTPVPLHPLPGNNFSHSILY